MNTIEPVKVKRLTKSEFLERVNTLDLEHPCFRLKNGDEMEGQLHGLMFVIGECDGLPGFYELDHVEAQFTVNVICCK